MWDILSSGSKGSTPRGIIFPIRCTIIPEIAPSKRLTDQLVRRLPAMHLRDGDPIKVEIAQRDRRKRRTHDRGGRRCRCALGSAPLVPGIDACRWCTYGRP
jgi:hypothetical protein